LIGQGTAPYSVIMYFHFVLMGGWLRCEMNWELHR